MSAKNCVTHHYACDCREQMHKDEIAALQKENEELRNLNTKVNEQVLALVEAVRGVLKHCEPTEIEQPHFFRWVEKVNRALLPFQNWGKP